jgi:heat shock protein HslJ
MEGPERMSLVIDHFVSASPSKTCAHRQAAAPLINTYWKLVRLNGKAVSVPEGGREPHLIFQAGVAPRLSAAAGCNQFGGTYAVDGDTVSFGPLAGTLMACPEPLDALERALVKLLAAPRQWRIAGQTLTLRDGDTVLAEFEAQYLP